MESANGLVTAIPYIIGGFYITVLLTCVAMTLGTVGGMALAGLRLSRIPFLSQFAIAWIEFFLLTPPLIHIMWAYYVLPIVTGWRIDPITVCALALSTSVAAHMAEVFRGGLQSIPRGQHRAARVLGLSYVDRYWFVILPQTLRVILAPSTNVLVTLVKDTSLASVIGVAEIMHRGQVTASANFNYLEILSFVVVCYVLINYPLVIASGWFEKKSKRGYAAA